MQKTENNSDLSSECKDIKEELLEYKLEEVSSRYADDFGEMPKGLAKEINEKITNPNLERMPMLEEVIRTLWLELIRKNLENIKKEIDSLRDSTVDFSDIIIELGKIERKLKRPSTNNELKECYDNDLRPIKIKTFKKIITEKNRRKEEKKREKRSIIYAIIIAMVFFILGIIFLRIVE